MVSNSSYYDITLEIEALTAQSLQNSSIDAGDYVRYDVERGLRDLNGKGVLTGLTEISGIIARKMVDKQETPYDGRLYYRGINVEKLVAGVLREERLGSEGIAYLLLLGRLPSAAGLESSRNQLAYYCTLPGNFIRDVILEAPSQDIMNSLVRSALNLASYDGRCNDISLPNVMRQCLQLVALFPALSVHDYQAYTHKSGNGLYTHAPQPELSTAENILSLLRPGSSYSFWETHVLDICLTPYAERGGGNNSTFITHMVISSGADIYSCTAAALAPLKGPKHGDANIEVIRILEDMREQVKDWKDEDEVRHYFQALLDRQAFDRAGPTYGMGYAVHFLSDPRTNLLHSLVEKLPREKGRMEEYELYSLVERLGPEIIAGEWKMYKGVSANMDFYSGFVYHMLDLPLEFYTPLFATARVAEWGVHRAEEFINTGKIIRPVYKYVGNHVDYVPLTER